MSSPVFPVMTLENDHLLLHSKNKVEFVKRNFINVSCIKRLDRSFFDIDTAMGAIQHNSKAVWN